MSFTDNHLEGTSIPSYWRSERSVSHNQTQTHEIEIREIGVSAISSKSAETQTLNLIDSHKIRPLKTFDCPELTEFVSKASQITIEILRKSKDSEIIERIERFQNRSKANVRMICKFYKQLSLISGNNELDFCVSSIAWNCNASVLAVGYKVSAHTDWCTHSSYALFWNLFKTSLSEEPSIVLEIDSCISTLISCSTQSSLYFSGALSGKISVWNTRNVDEPLIASVMAHQRPVSALQWIPSNKRPDSGLLVSSGLDGRVMVWKFSGKSLELEEVFQVLAQDMPKTMQIKRDNSEVGIVSTSFNCDDPNIFIIGCIGGAIFQCSLNKSKPILNKSDSIWSETKKVEFKSPIVMSYASHRSHISVIQFSPLSRNIFFSCSSDSELRIYNILQTIPLVVIHTESPLLSGQWSPSQPNIAAVGADGRVYVYCISDTKVSKATLSFAIGDQINAKSIVYNTIENNEQIAVIASNNEIQIWDLSASSQKTDTKCLDSLNRMTNEDNM